MMTDAERPLAGSRDAFRVGAGAEMDALVRRLRSVKGGPPFGSGGVSLAYVDARDCHAAADRLEKLAASEALLTTALTQAVRVAETLVERLVKASNRKGTA